MRNPRVSESAYIAPTAVLCVDVTVGPRSRVLFGAVITAEGGPVVIGAHCVIMEHAVIRRVPRHPTGLGDHALVGPYATFTGCVIEGDIRIGIGAVVFNGVRVELAVEVEFHAVVHVNTVVAAGTAVPMGWFAGSDPAQLVPPGDWDRIRELMGPLDYAGTVFGGGETDTPMPDIARRYARSLAVHNHDHALPPSQHDRLPDDPST